ncbi:MAG: SAM-dependent methyltransferase, partial [bacterium]|nr:SAM-dependent methyltransferase [bacterium]
QYDIVYTSYGALNWLNDIGRWTEIAASLLKPGGAVHVVEFHPYICTLGDDCQIEYSYFNNMGPIDYTSTETYTGDKLEKPYREIEWTYSLSDIINGLIKNGLQLNYLNEFPYQVYNCFPNMKEIEPGKWVFKAEAGRKIPYMFSLQAVKPVTDRIY